MNVLIVHAHPEPKSFNGAMTQRAVEVLRAQGHKVCISDLYAMNFDPVSDRRNFLTTADPDYLRLQNEELHAVRSHSFEPLIQTEIDKLLACNLLIFRFPIWWLSLPAILKGWVDRVLACGVAYGGGRYFDNGVLHGKRAMCALTVGGPAPVYSAAGLYADVESILYPVHHGIFGFTGMTALEPFVVYGPSRMSNEDRALELDRFEEHLANVENAHRLPLLKMADFRDGVRIQSAES
jgi:NAD(P)H dehydrogenase (quinone)